MAEDVVTINESSFLSIAEALPAPEVVRYSIGLIVKRG